jgi:hypothetical protein
VSSSGMMFMLYLVKTGQLLQKWRIRHHVHTKKEQQSKKYHYRSGSAESIRFSRNWPLNNPQSDP